MLLHGSLDIILVDVFPYENLHALNQGEPHTLPPSYTRLQQQTIYTKTHTDFVDCFFTAFRYLKISHEELIVWENSLLLKPFALSYFWSRRNRK